ncbi:LacI family DNA-binding transcriptional regulator [Schaalia vaccimaxillae]|uniref:LacI family DNA-binding transcriptional regulator n=1 Tax=Schaalia vaccimaxillae TaxID=183916 RepID=UPI00040C420A|nr:LacI family DNA-binding transcriptional regulator [Schaalia vaccimaxillae]
MNSEERSRPRLVDVAREAGVSVSTASRALGRGSDLIGAATRDHVRNVARKMGYRVNPIARSLRLASTGQIGMIVPSISNPFFMELVVEVEHCLAERGLSLLLCDARLSVSNEDKLLRNFEAGAVDGLIIAPCHETYSTPALARTAEHLPTVQLDRAVHVRDVPMVGVNDIHGMRSILKHLKDRGARNLAMLSNTGVNVSSTTRVSVARDTAEEYGMSLAKTDIIECNFSVKSAEEATHYLIGRGTLPDAVVCLNDLLAIGAITELRRNSIAIPEDILVTGFDDIQFAELMRPSITTLRQPLAMIAQTAVDFLLDEADAPERTCIPGELVIRESTVL